MTSQTAFRAALLDPSVPAPEGICNPDGAPATKRFDVYRNNVAVSLSDALETAFPVIRKLVGDEFFRAKAGVYLRQHPPDSPLMMFYGAEMPAFLEGFEPAKSLPYLPDIARLELAIRRAYHAADATPIDPAALTGIAEDDLPLLRMRFAPAMQLLISEHPVHGIWAANMAGGPPARPEPQAALVSRPEFDPKVDLLTHAQAVVLGALKDGAPLGLALRHGGAGFDLGPLLTLLLQRNAIISLTIED